MKSFRADIFRIFITCWLIFALHFATDIVREHYLTMSMVDEFSFRLDKYVGLHPDIFETPEHGAHHGANPGASMIAAIPYALSKPLIDKVVELTMNFRQQVEQNQGQYNDHRPARVRFYKKVREKGLDVKFGMVGFVTMVFCMAPLSAVSAAVMFSTLSKCGLSRGASISLTILYAFGTPVFFRTGYLNQNLMVGIFAFFAFVLLWNVGGNGKLTIRQRNLFAGLMAGFTLLCDYSGLVVLMIMGGYCIFRRLDTVSLKKALKDSLAFIYGASIPVLLLWFYQWQSFGYPFFPPQYSMPPQTYSDAGYIGVRLVSGELLWMLLFDYRFGLFIVSPVLIFGLIAPVMSYFKKSIIPLRESLFMIAFIAGITLFFSCIEYTRLQWITGIRYIVTAVPFLFLLTAAVLVRARAIIFYMVTLIAVAQSWCMSMVRPVGVENEESVIVAIKKVFLGGFQLPWLNTLSKMSGQYFSASENHNFSPVPLFLLWGIMIYGIWKIRNPWKKLGEG